MSPLSGFNGVGAKAINIAPLTGLVCKLPARALPFGHVTNAESSQW